MYHRIVLGLNVFQSCSPSKKQLDPLGHWSSVYPILPSPELNKGRQVKFFMLFNIGTKFLKNPSKNCVYPLYQDWKHYCLLQLSHNGQRLCCQFIFVLSYLLFSNDTKKLISMSRKKLILNNKNMLSLPEWVLYGSQWENLWSFHISVARCIFGGLNLYWWDGKTATITGNIRELVYMAALSKTNKQEQFSKILKLQNLANKCRQIRSHRFYYLFL